MGQLVFISNVGPGGGLPPLANEQYAVLMEDPAGNLVFQRLTEDMILPGFAISSWAKTNPDGATLLYRRGDEIVGMTATAAYASAADGASVANILGGSVGGGDIAPGAWAIPAPYTAATMAGSVRRDGADGGANPTLTVELTANKGAVVKTSSFVVTWGLDVYYGVGAAGITAEAAIKALSTQVLATARQRTFTVAPSNEKVYYAIPQSYGAATFVDTGTGFAVPFNLVVPVPALWTNVNGVQNTYDLYESVQLLTSPALTIQVN